MLALLLPLALLVALGAVLDWRAADRLVDQLHDRALASTAVGLSARLETDRDGDLPAHLVSMMNTVRSNPKDKLFYLVRDEHGRDISGDGTLASLIPEAGDDDNPSFADATAHGEPVRVSVYRYRGPDGSATIVVAETLHERTEQVRKAIASSIATNLAMAVAVAAAAALAIGFALRPLSRLGHQFQQHGTRDIGAMRPLRLRSVPTEIVPLGRALNRLIRRLRRTVQTRQAFVNNTAHQLRTPLAGLGAQVQLLAQQPLAPAHASRVREIADSISRLSHMVGQLLWLARADDDAMRRVPMEAVDLPGLLQQTASSFLDQALARDVDLGFEPSEARIHGSTWLLRELLGNLVDNAITHTPRGSVVTVRCGVDVRQPGHAFLEVEDNGLGIAPEDRGRVFGRFVRLAGDDRQGSGLGLAIVREIAALHRASISMLEALEGSPNARGLRVRVIFPVTS